MGLAELEVFVEHASDLTSQHQVWEQVSSLGRDRTSGAELLVYRVDMEMKTTSADEISQGGHVEG